MTQLLVSSKIKFPNHLPQLLSTPLIPWFVYIPTSIAIVLIIGLLALLVLSVKKLITGRQANSTTDN